MENAIKYTPRGGSIHLVSRKIRGGGIEVAIKDDGPGIPSWDRERVKERFVRLDKSRSLPGSGLGLDPDRPGLSAALIFPRAKGFRSGDINGVQQN